jgi:CRISPR/Cas system-associated endonuclease Cas3-HD
MEQNREIVYLAVLLHDIGKLYQCADTRGILMMQDYYINKINENGKIFFEM